MRARARWRTVVLVEAGTWRGLGRWVRRRRDVPPDAEAFDHHRLSAPILWLFVAVSAIEVVALDLLLHALLPWAPLRIAVAALGVWGLLWMLGMLGCAVTRPHLLTSGELRVRGGPVHDVQVPLAAVAAARPQDKDLRSSMRVLQVSEPDELLLGVSGRTNIALTLRSPTTLETATGPVRVSTVRLWADEPRALVRRLQDIGADPAGYASHPDPTPTPGS